MPMLIKDLHSTWPPASHYPQNSVRPDLGDVVVSGENKGNGKFVVRLRKPSKYGQEYLVTLTVPENVLQSTLFSIFRKTGMTLGEVGEIPIRQAHPQSCS